MIRLFNSVAKRPATLLQNGKVTFSHHCNDCACSCHGGLQKSQSPPGAYSYLPRTHGKELLTKAEIAKEAKSIFEWAKSKGAERYSFIAYPHTDGICEKQDSFLNIDWSYEPREFKDLVSQEFPGSILVRGEADGSSFPNGGLRQTHTARAYTIWDADSHLYVRRRNKTLYIPALIVTHHGKSLGHKTLFRQSEQALETSTTTLLGKLGVESIGIRVLLGLEQEFFVIPTAAYEKREDLKWLGRCLFGTVPAKNQQLSQHYYGKMPFSIEQVLEEIEEEYLEVGIPFKTRHNEVANNQFEIACIFGEAGITMDQNILATQIINEAFQRHGMTALFHEKPFNEINGSGKHANWNVAYVKKDGSLTNLFKYSEKHTPEERKIYKLFILIQLMAVMKNEKLYLSAIATPGNEIRLGGHEAPPRIFSVFLGDALSSLLDNTPAPQVKNLRDLLPSICFNQQQQNSDRNRTSPFAYTGKVFEFRALGSSQNAGFPMAVIAASMADEVNNVIKLLDNGQTVDQIIEKYVVETRKIRFDGDGYSDAWKQEAKKRGLYVNEKFAELYTFLDTEQEIFTKLGVTTPEENAARSDIAKSKYMSLVEIEVDTLIYTARRHIIPHAMNYLTSIAGDFESGALKSYYRDVSSKLDTVVSEINKIEENKKAKSSKLEGCQFLREQVGRVGDLITELVKVVPKNPNFPDQSEFLNL